MGRLDAQHGGQGATAGDPRIVIAVLDGPVDMAHPCFDGARLTVLPTLAGADAVAATDNSALAHGTHVASIIFGQPGSDIEGIAHGCSGLIVPIFGGATATCSQLDLARAITIALEHGAHIINISSGQPAESGEAEPLLARAIAGCAERNVLIVAAAGNDGCACLHLPAAAESVLAVGAMDSGGEPLASSNWGEAYRSKGLLAPGSDVPGATPGGGTARRSGTSYAAPHVAASAGLLMSLQLAAGGKPDAHAVRSALLATVDPCPEDTDDACSRFLAGTINIGRATAAITASNNQNRGGRIMTDFEWTNGLRASDAEPFTPPGEAAERHEPAAGLRPSAETVPGFAHEAAGQIAPSDCGCGCGGKKEASGDCGCGCGGKKAEGAKSGDCGCGGGGATKKPQLVYALGKLGIDFGSEARRDSLLQAMSMMPGEATTADDVLTRLLDYFEAAPYDAASVIWTLNLDATPIYAIHPVGAYAAQAYERLREALRAQIASGADLISVPGVIGGALRLQSGQQVPAIMPAMRGIYSWATRPLVEHVLGAVPTAAAALESYNRFAAGLTNYLDRVYYDLRNLGVTGEERALNYSATNAVQIASVVRSATADALDLDRIAVRKSPVCRPDSECYDVELSFFNPGNTNVANRVYRFTVDVSDVIPVTIGQVRSWTRRV